MYKCKECGIEYENKPDYCDCGNDEFELVQETIIAESIQTNSPADKKNEDKTFKPEPKPAKQVHVNSFKADSEKASFEERYPELNKTIKSVNPVSIIIFGLCLLLSLYVLLFAWNPKESDTEIIKTEETATKKAIPSIDKFWNNTPPVKKEQPVKKDESKQNLINQSSPIQQKTVQQTPAQTKTTAKNVTQNKNKTTKVSQTKTTAKPKQTTTPVINTNNKTKTQTQTKTKASGTAKNKAAEDAAKKAAAAEAQKKAEQQLQAKKAAEEQAKKAAEEKAIQQELDKQEFAKYKINLRNTIGRKIDFTKVIGDGSCTVAFKISPAGKLVSRSFAKQSTNTTLNDAVYAAVMATPSYNPPPKAYNDEVLYLYIKFNNGNFEISLK